MNQKNISRNRKVISKRRSRRRSPKIIRKKSKRKSYYPISNIVVGSISGNVFETESISGNNLGLYAVSANNMSNDAQGFDDMFLLGGM